MQKQVFVFSICAVFALGIFFTAGVYTNAQTDKGRFGGDRKMFDAKNTEVLSGEVVKIDKTKPPMPNSPEILVVTLKTDTETISVMLGTESVLEKQGVEIKVKDKIEVKGMRVGFIAMELKKGKIAVKLQDRKMPPPRD